MNRKEATAKLTYGEARFSLTAGLLRRRSVRKFLKQNGVDFFEQWGILESRFTVRGEQKETLEFLKELKEEFPE